MKTSGVEGPLSPTLAEMQHLNDGFQALADQVLRHAYDFLRPLKPYGINSEGKPIAGVPDSYVGVNPSQCRIAVQHTTTKLDRLSAKFVSDYNDVVERCPGVELIILCTNRPQTPGVDATVLAKAKLVGKSVQLVWGEELARILDEQRQDLRHEHLNIPLERLTKASLVSALAVRVTQATATYLGNDEVLALQQRIRRLPLESQFSRLRPSERDGVTLIVGAAGLGKTSWSAATAIRLSRTVPVVWLPAKGVGTGGINSALVTAAYGTDSAERVHELAQVLRLSGRKLIAFLDAIDEHADYQQLQEALQAFNAQSPLATTTHLVLTCRDEALGAFKNVEPNVLPSENYREGGRHLVLSSLPEEQSLQLLRRLGVNETELAEIKANLPEPLFSNPLYLKLARRLQVDGVSPKADDWIESFANHYLRNIRSRLRSNPPLTNEIISAGLEALAVPTLLDPQGLDEERARALLPTCGSVDQDTYLERAVQSGVLVRSDRKLRFCHALFAEYFAAKSIASDLSSSVNKAIALIATLPGRISIAHFAVRLKPELLPALAKQHPQLIPKFERSRLDQDTLNNLNARALELLNSEYPSERLAAGQIVGSLGPDMGGRTAVDWFNSLDAPMKQLRLWEASELFLELQLSGAVSVVAFHEYFRMSPDFPWYDFDFKRRLDSTSPAFRTALTDVARKGFVRATPSEDEAARLTMVLTYLGDKSLVERLRAKAEHGPLTRFEHRALMMFNSDDAMEVYLCSWRHYSVHLDTLKKENDPKGVQRVEIWKRLVPRQTDIRMFPNDALVRLAARMLKSSDEHDVLLGTELAELLGHPDLVDEYALASKRRGFLFSRDMVSRLVAGSDGSEIVRLYEACPSDEARGAILAAAGEIPGTEVETLLLNALENEKLFNAACIGLAKQRSVNAAFLLHKRLDALTGYRAHLACKVLARCAYEPALDNLIKMMEAAREASEKDQWLSEYHLLCCIGEVGGAAAYNALTESWGRDMNETILAFLLDAHDECALRKVREILTRYPEAKDLLSSAIQHRDHLREDISYFSDAPPRFEFNDRVLLKALLESAYGSLEEAKAERSRLIPLKLEHDAEAIAMFDLPDAHAFLRYLANLTVSNSNSVGERASRFARRTLGLRGDRGMAKICVQESLQSLSGRYRISSHDIDRLAEWPREVVRECLLETVGDNPTNRHRWLHLLSFFSSKHDVRLFRENLKDLPAELADEILQKLRTI